MSTKAPVRELLFTMTFQLTGATDFGLTLDAVLSGQAPMPPAGLRLDFSAAGEVQGDKIRGKMQSVDYAHLRPDGVSMLHIHGIITTDDGARISIAGEGVATAPPGATAWELRESLRLHTAAPDYVWLNQVLVWATGETDLATGKARLEMYIA